MKPISTFYTPVVEVGLYGTLEAVFRMALAESFATKRAAADLDAGASIVRIEVSPSQFGPTLKLQDLGVEVGTLGAYAEALSVTVVIQRQSGGRFAVMAGVTLASAPDKATALEDAKTLQRRTGRTCRMVKWDHRTVKVIGE